MSLTFTQITSLIDRNCKSNTVSYSLADKVTDINLALDTVFEIIFKNSKVWNFDDSNHTDHPIITTNLVASQRDYSFTSDANGNLILDIFKVVVKNKEGKYYELEPVDPKSEAGMQGFWDGQNLTGLPTRYAKSGNSIFLDCIPDYNSVAGLKIYINREGSYFTVNDTTKKPGFAGIFHEYLALRPSYFYARTNDLKNQEALKRDMMEMEQKIEEFYSKRDQDEKTRIITKWRSPR